MNAYLEASDTAVPATLRGEDRRAGKHRCDARRTQRAESCGVVDESCGPARALRAVWTSPWTTRARRPPPCPHSRASRPQAPQDDQQQEIPRNRTGQLTCYKTGQFYLLPTVNARWAKELPKPQDTTHRPREKGSPPRAASEETTLHAQRALVVEGHGVRSPSLW